MQKVKPQPLFEQTLSEAQWLLLCHISELLLFRQPSHLTKKFDHQTKFAKNHEREISFSSSKEAMNATRNLF